MTNHTLSDWLSALERVTGKAPRRSGDEYCSPCPAHGGDGFNLSIVERDGKILTTCHSRGCDHEAIRAALGIEAADGRAVEHRYAYRRADGSLHLTVHMKRDAVTGKKIGRPWREPRGVKGPHPLYRLPELLEAGREFGVVVVEGEHTCDAVRAAWPDKPVVTWAGGCKAWRQTDWSPLAGWKATICTDADSQGRAAGREIAERLHGQGCTVAMVLPDGENGDDLADWLAEGKQAARERVQVLRQPFQPPEGLPFLTIAELLDRPEDATVWLVEGVLPADGFGAFAGKPKAGKSTAARHLAHCIATGEPWLDRATMTGPVLYLALEEKVSEVRRHFQALGTPRDAPLHVCFHRTPGDAEKLLGAAVEATRPALVVVDTLFRFQPVRDTDAYGDVLAALAPLHELARTSGAHVLVVHHERKAEGKGGDRVLGSTAIFGTVDVLLSVERRYADNVRVLSSIGRYGEDLPETVIELRSDGSVALAGAVDEIQARRARDMVLAFVTEHPGCTQQEIREGVELRWKLAHAALQSLAKAGQVTHTGSGCKGDPRHHFVANSCSRPNPVPESSFPVPSPYRVGNRKNACSGNKQGTGGTGIRKRGSNDREAARHRTRGRCLPAPS